MKAVIILIFPTFFSKKWYKCKVIEFFLHKLTILIYNFHHLLPVTITHRNDKDTTFFKLIGQRRWHDRRTSGNNDFIVRSFCGETFRAITQEEIGLVSHRG